MPGVIHTLFSQFTIFLRTSLKRWEKPIYRLWRPLEWKKSEDRPKCPHFAKMSSLQRLKTCDGPHKDSHTNTHTHTHTHTHVGFYGLRGLSIGVMVFILYKLYVLLPYTYPTPKLSPHRRRCISIFPQKNSLCMIYKHFKLWGHWKCPHKSPSPCNTYVIPMSLYKFVSS